MLTSFLFSLFFSEQRFRFTKEINELVDEWTPEPLGRELTLAQQADLAAMPVIVGAPGPKPRIQSGKSVTNLAGYNFAGLAGNEAVKERAVKVLREYGLGSCGPPGFYGTVGKRPSGVISAHIITHILVKIYISNSNATLRLSWVRRRR